MKLAKKISGSLADWSFIGLLVINNFIACFFLAFPFLAGLSFPYHKYSETEIYLRIALFGLTVSLIFTLISLALSNVFKKYFLPVLTGQLKFFLIQFGFLFVIFALIFVYTF